MNHLFTIIAVVATLVLLVLHVTGSVVLSPLVILSPLLLAFLPIIFCLFVTGLVIIVIGVEMVAGAVMNLCAAIRFPSRK